MSSKTQIELLKLFSHVSKDAEAKDAVPGTLKLNLRDLGIGIAPRGRSCSLFVWKNMIEAMALAELFMSQSTCEEFMRVSKECCKKVNEEIFVFATMYAVIHRKDCRGLELPSVEEVLPYWYFPSPVIAEAARKVKASEAPLDPEHRLAYFREDIGVNSHHWHWHLIYPTTWEPNPKRPTDIRDRKGELFYYMHHQIIARYEAERLSNGLGRVRPFHLTHALKEAYFPNLSLTISGQPYAARQAMSLPRDTVDVTIESMLMWKSRILNDIHTGYVTKRNGEKIQLVEPQGIDILGDIVEASALSLNRDFYGDFHNSGHRIISKIHDPDGRYGGEDGVMSVSTTAMRDPAFYRWHKTIDDMFNEYKLTLTPYTRQELEWTDIQVQNVSVTGNVTKQSNILRTFWQNREVLLSEGIDFGRSIPVSVSYHHLQHEEFVYEIKVNNISQSNKQVVVRMFLCPVSNEVHKCFSLTERRLLYIELDKYQTTVQPGYQVLRRRSEDSNVTVSPGRGFQQLSREKPIPELSKEKVGSAQADKNQELAEKKGFCGCGWPAHLLLPKGKPEGMRFQLLVMITDWEKDQVENLPEKTCGDAASYCGVRDQKYPDKRNMGFPFDRPFTNDENLDSFISISNVASTDIIIRHSGEVLGKDGVVKPAQIY
ncbi:Polyphenol oxidase 1 [Chamberlinius hualienensis]